LYATVMHPPVMGSTVKSLDNKETLAVKGVKGTETIPTYKPPVNMQALGGVAVLADSTWAAMQGRKKLKVEWEESAHKVFNSGPYRKELEETARKPGKVIREVGNVDEGFAKGGRVIEAEYYAPLLAHASMEPPAALAVYRDGKVEVWAPTQSPQGARDAIAEAVGAKKEDVIVHVTLLGGAFGRKSFPDFAVEAAVLAKKTGKPVKVVWTREDDIRFDSYHSVSAMYMKAAVGADGMPAAWLQRTVFPPIGSTFDANAVYSDAGNWDWDFRICRMRFQIIARRMDRRRRTCALDGCGQWRTFIMRLRFSRSRMNWRMRRARIRWNIRWRCWGRIALCRNRSCRRITRTMAGITSSIRSIRHASNASHGLRRTKPGGEKEKTGTDLGWASRCIAAS